MKTTIMKPVEVEIATVSVILPVNYEEEDMPNDFPLRQGDQWRATIDIDTGKINDWPAGRSGKFFMKVCDGGTYTLRDPSGNVLAERQDYVPNDLIPGEYGDYVHLQINEEGLITNWPKEPDVSQFFEDE